MKKMLGFAAATFLLPIGGANAAGQPEMKEGLWSIHTHTQSIGTVWGDDPENNPGNQKSEETESSQKVCRSHALDEKARSLAKNREGCTTIGESFEDSTYSLELHCVKSMTIFIDTKEMSTFQGDTSIHTELRGSLKTPWGVVETTTIQDEKYIGRCPEGAEPGDMIEEDGRVNHQGKR